MRIRPARRCHSSGRFHLCRVQSGEHRSQREASSIHGRSVSDRPDRQPAPMSPRTLHDADSHDQPFTGEPQRNRLSPLPAVIERNAKVINGIVGCPFAVRGQCVAGSEVRQRRSVRDDSLWRARLRHHGTTRPAERQQPLRSQSCVPRFRSGAAVRTASFDPVEYAGLWIAGAQPKADEPPNVDGTRHQPRVGHAVDVTRRTVEPFGHGINVTQAGRWTGGRDFGHLFNSSKRAS